MTSKPGAEGYSVAVAARDALGEGEQCDLLSVAPETPTGAVATRVADTIVVTADVRVTYVYKVSKDTGGD